MRNRCRSSFPWEERTDDEINQERVWTSKKKANRTKNTIGFRPSLRPNPPSHPDLENGGSLCENTNRIWKFTRRRWNSVTIDDIQSASLSRHVYGTRPGVSKFNEPGKIIRRQKNGRRLHRRAMQRTASPSMCKTPCWRSALTLLRFLALWRRVRGWARR